MRADGKLLRLHRPRRACAGKSAATARLQDELTGALVSLARAASGNENLLTATTHTLVQEALFTTLTNVSFNDNTITALIDRVHAEKNRLAPGCAPATRPAVKPATMIWLTCGAPMRTPAP